MMMMMMMMNVAKRHGIKGIPSAQVSKATDGRAENSGYQAIHS